MFEYPKILLILGFLGLQYCFVSASNYPFGKKTVTADLFEKYTYSRMCFDQDLEAKVASFCGDNDVGGGGGRCVKNFNILLRTDHGHTTVQQRTVVVCYKNNRPFKCLTGGEKAIEVTIWDYENAGDPLQRGVMACSPKKVTDKLRSSSGSDESTGCSNCFGLFK